MQELEKILEEIELEKKRLVFYPDCSSAFSAVQIRTIEKIEQIICKYMSNCNRINDGWIPAEKRLPTKEECEKDNNEFLVQTDTGKRFSCEYEPLANGYDNPLWCCNVPVVAWQPLPELYRPERRDNHDRE